MAKHTNQRAAALSDPARVESKPEPMNIPDQVEELCPLSRVRGMTGLGTTYIYGEMKEDRFPKPVRVGRRSLWLLSEIQGWIAHRKIARDQVIHENG
ncbi:helix-turn-helix transcriptional regulator [Xanthomonas oryzae]|uniref:helix-turn-helix transcriptional regulator n=1 Tax=Xanthomonas oryzae TaxID=347 RepID=UPI000B064E8B|nr:AlpA family phage regulatory protein [Xanthomonas oryzae]